MQSSEKERKKKTLINWWIKEGKLIIHGLLYDLQTAATRFSFFLVSQTTAFNWVSVSPSHYPSRAAKKQHVFKTQFIIRETDSYYWNYIQQKLCVILQWLL